MKIRAQISMVLNLDKCIGCHTCSVTCKNIWTNRKGVEYAWFNNVESKPGIGYPKNWEDQEKWKGGWKVDNGKLELKAGGRFHKMMNLFANPDMPEIDDYYEPFEYKWHGLKSAPLSEATPTARPVSRITGKDMEKIEWGPNWEDDLAGEFEKRSKDVNFDNVNKEIYKDFENTFQMYLPRLCNHCLNPACVASCPSGAIYKRKEDGIVLADQDKCRGWRMCMSGCPYKKVYYNWESGKAEKCIGCYPRIESGLPMACAESCVGRIRYVGVMLYDADRIEATAATENEQNLYQAHLDTFLDPHDPEIIKQALADDVPQSWIDAAQKSPVYKMAKEWKIAFPIHPEYRTLPMMWYVPPLSPVQSQIDKGNLETSANGILPTAKSLRLPAKYLANIFTAGDEKPIISSITKLLAMRSHQRSMSIEGKQNEEALAKACLSAEQAEEMYRYLGIANWEDRFVIPTSHEEMRHEDPYGLQGYSGFTGGNISSHGEEGGKGFSLFPAPRKKGVMTVEHLPHHKKD